MQNVAARIVTRTRRHEHITPVLHSLHQLPVSYRIQYKVLLLTFKALNGQPPSYLTESLQPYQPYQPIRHLRFTAQHLLTCARHMLCHCWRPTPRTPQYFGQDHGVRSVLATVWQASCFTSTGTGRPGISPVDRAGHFPVDRNP